MTTTNDQLLTIMTALPSTLRPTERAVYLAVYACALNSNHSPSQADIRRLTGIVTDDTVRTAVKGLIDGNLLQTTKVNNRLIYRLSSLPDVQVDDLAIAPRGKMPESDDRTMADGCTASSHLEDRVCTLLRFHEVPHISQVPYRVLCPSIDREYRADYALSQTVLIEVAGKAGPDYAARLDEKKRVAEAHGLTLFVISNDDDLFELITSLVSKGKTRFPGARDAEHLAAFRDRVQAHFEFPSTHSYMLDLNVRIDELARQALQSKVYLPTDRRVIDGVYIDPRAVRGTAPVSSPGLRAEPNPLALSLMAEVDRHLAESQRVIDGNPSLDTETIDWEMAHNAKPFPINLVDEDQEDDDVSTAISNLSDIL